MDFKTRAVVKQNVEQWISSRWGISVHHNRGLVILAPPGSGKTHFVEKLPSPKQFVDSDEILGDPPGLGIHPSSWNDRVHTPEEETAHYRLCEAYLSEMKVQGLWVVSSLFEDMDPDAIVLIPEEEHKRYVEKRDDLEWPLVKKVRQMLGAKVNVPQYSSWLALVWAVSLADVQLE